MNKDTAINLLRSQKEEFLEVTNENFHAWKVHTMSLIRDFLGEPSIEYRAAKNLRMETVRLGSDFWHTEGSRTSHREDVIQFLDNCIKKIETSGLYKQPKKRFLQEANNANLIAVCIFVAGAIGSACFMLGKYTSDVQNFELEQEIRLKTDSIIELKSILNRLQMNTSDKAPNTLSADSLTTIHHEK